MSNSYFEFLRVPVFYLPYLRHPANVTGRESGLLIPVASNSSIRGYTFGEQLYWVINRSMDMTVGTEYYSKRGWAPSGDFRYKGSSLNHLLVRWNALLNRGVEQPATGGGTTLVNQGGMDAVADLRRTFPRKHAWPARRSTCRATFTGWSSTTATRRRSAPKWQAMWRSPTHTTALSPRFRWTVPSFASAANGDEARILHLPAVRFDVLDRPLGDSILLWGLGSSLSYLGRSELGLHANVGRYDVYPHLVVPLSAGGWSLVSEAALRDTVYRSARLPT